MTFSQFTEIGMTQQQLDDLLDKVEKDVFPKVNVAYLALSKLIKTTQPDPFSCNCSSAAMNVLNVLIAMKGDNVADVIEGVSLQDNNIYMEEANIIDYWNRINLNSPNLPLVDGYTITYTPPTANTSASISFKKGEDIINIDPPIALLQYIAKYLNDKLQFNVNPQEYSILINKSISDILAFYTQVVQVQRITGIRFQGMGGWQDPSGHPNAFKHVLLAAMRVRQFGSGVARQLVDAHETGVPNYNPNEIGTQMDAANNDIGIALGQSFVGDINALINHVYNLAKTGQLWTVNFNTNPQSLQKVPF